MNFFRKKEKFYLEKYALSNNTYQDFWKLYPKSLEDKKNEGEYKKILISITNTLALPIVRKANIIKLKAKKTDPFWG